MTDMNFEEYTKMMLAGGRSPEGVRSIRENAARDAVAKVAIEDEKLAGEIRKG